MQTRSWVLEEIPITWLPPPCSCLATPRGLHVYLKYFPYGFEPFEKVQTKPVHSRDSPILVSLLPPPQTPEKGSSPQAAGQGRLTLVMGSHGWYPDIIVGPSVSDEDHQLPLVGLGFLEELLQSVVDGSPCAGATAPIAHPLDGIEDIRLAAIFVKPKLQPLLVGVLHGPNARVCLRNLKLLAEVGYKLKNRAEVARPYAAGAVDDEANVG